MIIIKGKGQTSNPKRKIRNWESRGSDSFKNMIKT